MRMTESSEVMTWEDYLSLYCRYCHLLENGEEPEDQSAAEETLALLNCLRDRCERKIPGEILVPSHPEIRLNPSWQERYNKRHDTRTDFSIRPRSSLIESIVLCRQTGMFRGIVNLLSGGALRAIFTDDNRLMLELVNSS